MTTELRILLAEDNQVDAELIQREMTRAGLEYSCLRVDTCEAFDAALRDFNPDLVLSDNALPAFDALSALALTKQALPDVGFVVVSGTLGEERAVEMLKGGVTDYVLKHHLYRLGPVVQRALAEAEGRRAARAAEAAAREANERFRGAFEDAPAGMAVMGLDGRLLQVNRALCELLGRNERDLLRSTLDTVTHPLELADGQGLLDGLLTLRGASTPAEQRLLHVDGHAVWVLMGVSRLQGPDGQPVGFVGQFVDLMATKDAQARLRHDALYDRLTGLPNRTLIEGRLARALSQSDRAERPLAVLFVDLDHFKVVNDNLGYRGGDLVLVAVAPATVRRDGR